MSQPVHQIDLYNETRVAEQELVIILENGTEPTPVRAIRRPEPKLRAPIHVPFPPAIDATSLIRTNKEGALLARCTNKFLIYRNQFAKEVRSQGYNLSMSEVSCLAAQAWKQEPNHVIKKYGDIAQEVKWLHKQLSKSGSKNKKKASLDSSSNSSISGCGEDGESQDGETKKQISKHNVLGRLSNIQYQGYHDMISRDGRQETLSPILNSTPLTPLTPTFYSPTSPYLTPPLYSPGQHPRMSDVLTDGLLTGSYYSNTNNNNHQDERNVDILSLDMITPFEISNNYCNNYCTQDQFSMNNGWIYNQQYLHEV
ncbi:9492_t:CDS:1 [Diversispora eburnea]|uniref:9492_t:CDS:1 n=1 Tax=Diversispora eburnea TaxID=1213867 RepID=A0A9N8UYR0_9GLOM|nr:9492_t:CDS:1 [Diversispora eburnea]